ncbi:MAG TPA: metallophosphoesterase [Thermoanaerobaculia bacterium]
MIRLLSLLAALPLLVSCAAYGQAQAQPQDPPGTWYFAVSGDSRDCGDLIMPKIAHAVAGDREHPAAFYWHLGDFRRMYGPDCDIVKRTHPDWDCKSRPEDQLGPEEMDHYLDTAWDDFIERQVRPFAPTPVFLGIGNHELGAGRTALEYQRKFQPWLTSGPIHNQRVEEANDHFYSTEGATYYHFVRHGGTDFIYLDNASSDSFSADQIHWLERVLSRDQANPAIKTIVAGMHAALPFSRQSGHAMDASCQGLCSGQQVYDLLYRTQLKGKRVYVFTSHSHLFADRLFETDEHKGQVLTGWLVGTAGAEQYTEQIQYGYALVAVHPDGTLDARFQKVRRDSPPLATGSGAEPLTAFCFEQNKRPSGDSAFKGTCACGQAQP